MQQITEIVVMVGDDKIGHIYWIFHFFRALWVTFVTGLYYKIDAYCYYSTLFVYPFENVLVVNLQPGADPRVSGHLTLVSSALSKQLTHWLINSIDTKAKCRHNKIWPVKRLCVRCLSVWGPDPYIPPPFTLYTCIQAYLFTQGRGMVGGKGGVEPEKRLRGGNSSQSWVENPTLLNVSPVYKLW